VLRVGLEESVGVAAVLEQLEAVTVDVGLVAVLEQLELAGQDVAGAMTVAVQPAVGSIVEPAEVVEETKTAGAESGQRTAAEDPTGVDQISLGSSRKYGNWN
jgi:hypothetical protein